MSASNASNVTTDLLYSRSHNVPIYFTYFLIALIGSLLCLYVTITILRNRKDIHKEIFVVMLAIGCLILTLPCGLQCLMDSFKTPSEFEKKDSTCDGESMSHLISITLQFSSITMIAIKSYLNIVNEKRLTGNKLYLIIIFVILTSIIGSIYFGSISETAVMPSGTWCFYKFSSKAIYIWFLGNIIITLLAILICYIKIFLVLKRANKRVHAYVSNDQNLHVTVGIRIAYFIGVFLIFWSLTVIGIIYELSGGKISAEFDIAMLMLGLGDTIFTPMVYGFKCNCNFRKRNMALELIKMRKPPSLITIESVSKPTFNSFKERP